MGLVDELKSRVREAEAAAERALREAVRANGLSEEHRAAAERTLARCERDCATAYREPANATGEEHAVLYDIGCRPEAAVSGASLFQDEYRAFLMFNVSTAGAAHPEGTLAVVELVRAHSVLFGLPNDEALGGHPLHGRGLQCYGVYEVLNSRWKCEAERRNRVCFPNARPWDVRHFVFTFHDSSLECLAGGLRVELTRRSRAETVAQVLATIERGG